MSAMPTKLGGVLNFQCLKAIIHLRRKEAAWVIHNRVQLHEGCWALSFIKRKQNNKGLCWSYSDIQAFVHNALCSPIVGDRTIKNYIYIFLNIYVN